MDLHRKKKKDFILGFTSASASSFAAMFEEFSITSSAPWVLTASEESSFILVLIYMITRQKSERRNVCSSLKRMIMAALCLMRRRKRIRRAWHFNKLGCVRFPLRRPPRRRRPQVPRPWKPHLLPSPSAERSLVLQCGRYSQVMLPCHRLDVDYQ